MEYLGSCSRENIENVEAKYNLALPCDYATFLTDYNGAIADPEAAVELTSICNSIEIDSLFGLKIERKWLDFEHWMDKYCDELPSNTTIIGRDVLGGFLVLICSGESTGVYYWDSALNFEESTVDSNVYFISNSFSDFLKKLQN